MSGILWIVMAIAQTQDSRSQRHANFAKDAAIHGIVTLGYSAFDISQAQLFLIGPCHPSPNHDFYFCHLAFRLVVSVYLVPNRYLISFFDRILAVPTTSCLHAVAHPAEPSLPNRRNTHSFPIHDCSQKSIQPLVIRLESPHPEPSSITPKNLQDKSRTKSSQRNAIIAISTIGGTFVLCFLLALVRCACRYKRPPKRDRIAEAIERDNLQREMEQLARDPHALRQPLVREPAPPYIPRPPSYSETLSESLPRVGTDRNVQPPTMNSPSSLGVPITNSQTVSIPHIPNSSH